METRNKKKLSFRLIIPIAIRLLVVVAAITFFLLLIYGGINWVTSCKSPLVMNHSRSIITISLIGLVAVFALWAIIACIGIVKPGFKDTLFLPQPAVDTEDKTLMYIRKFAKDNVTSIEYLFFFQASLALIAEYNFYGRAMVFPIILSLSMFALSQISFKVDGGKVWQNIARIGYFCFSSFLTYMMAMVIKSKIGC